jgi:alginate O-acetyltransferase complex protein AlgI
LYLHFKLMIFNSLHFLAFFLTVTVAYYALHHKYRWQLLLAASCYFYMTFLPVYILILFFTIIIDYFAGIWIEKSIGKRRKIYLVFSLLANLGVLAIFKYYNFINSNLSILFNEFGYANSIPNLSILLPIGLSFHTFQAMSYTIEVYRGNQQSEKHFGIYALYVMFYPQLVAGPIERPQNILHQFYQNHKFDYTRVTSGLKLMAWGFFKKVVIADRVAVYVDEVYNNPANFFGLPLIVATFLFAIQIYCDFSGYSDIAIGSARVMGFKLMKNFDRPYFSTSISQFWTKWHISLSSWFRDYLYIPLGGNRVKVSRLYFNILITFLLSGLWHGANWTYILWGGLNGFYIIFESIATKNSIARQFIIKVPPRISDLLGILITFGLINVSWIFFRANSVGDAWYIVTHLFTHLRESIPAAISPADAISKLDLVLSIYSITILFSIEIFQSRNNISELISSKSTLIRYTLYFLLIVAIIMTGAVDSDQEFIYFQF